jgi:hypothetical protein
MIRFTDIGLKEKVKMAIETFQKIGIDGEIDCVEFKNFVEETCNSTSDDDNQTIDSKSTVYIYMYESETAEISTNAFINMAQQVKVARLIDNSIAMSNNEALFLIEAVDYDSQILIDNLIGMDICTISDNEYAMLWESKVKINDKDYLISLVNEFTIFHILVEQSKDYDKNLPPYQETDVFIRVFCENGINQTTSQELADAFIFELASSHNIYIDYTVRPQPLYSDYVCDDSIAERNFSIFPLLSGKGIPEVIKIYNKSISVNDLDFKILCLTRVIEYVAPTVVREKINSDIIMKLKSPKIFNPDAEFVSELEATFENNKKFRTDKELLNLAIQTIVDRQHSQH